MKSMALKQSPCIIPVFVSKLSPFHNGYRHFNDQVMSTAHAFIVPELIGCQVDPKTKR